MSLLSPQLWETSQQALNYAKNTYQFYHHITSLTTSEFNDESVNFFIKHFSEDIVICGFLFPYFSQEAREQILECLPKALTLPTVASQTIYDSFNVKKEHCHRKYSQDKAAQLIQCYALTEEMKFYCDAYFENKMLEKSITHSSFDHIKKI